MKWCIYEYTVFGQMRVLRLEIAYVVFFGITCDHR